MNLVSCRPRAQHVPALIALSLLCLSCSSTLKVQSSPLPGVTRPRDEPGLPFYVKREVYRQHTVYEQRWYDVQVSSARVVGIDSKTHKPETEEPTTVLRHVSKVSEATAAIHTLQTLVAGFEQTGGTAESAAAQQKKLEEAIAGLDAFVIDPGGPPEEIGKLLTVRNHLERALVVDYRQVYYLNGKSSWLSAGSVNTELAKDGTLAKAEGQAGGGLSDFLTAAAGVVTGFLPIKETLQSKWVKQTTSPGITAPVTTVTGLRVQVTIKEAGFQYEFTREFADPPCSQPPASDHASQEQKETVSASSVYPALDVACVGQVSADFAHGTFVRSALEAAGKEPEKPAYSVQGRIELPKSEEGEGK